ncbi:MAG: DoxX family membrane protein [Candidatus Kapabacteria bacterium]|nr:DoxX family membrane protein [Candidatus Kapabacteria bacterium]
MNILTKWFSGKNELSYSFIRIFLGIALLVRGALLASDISLITAQVGSNQWYWWYSYIVVIHTLGGLLLAIGLATRLAAFFQIPILAGALFFVHLKSGLVKPDQSLELSALVLVLLIIFFIFGSEKLSIDAFIAKRKLKQLNSVQKNK